MSPVNANAGEYKSRIGLDSLYIAEVTADSASGYTADTPEYFAPAAEASQEPATSFEIQYADDQPYDVMAGEGPTKITLSVTNIPAEMLAKITGNVFDASTGRVFDHTGTPPYCALLFRSLKSNGKYRYYSYLKGQFNMPKEETATKGETPEPKTMQLEYTAIKTVYSFDLGSINGTVKRVIGDEDTTNFSATGWFSQVQTPATVAPSALALSASDPVDEATDVAITKTCTLTFNNALINNSIYNVSLIKRTDESVVASAISLDTTKKIITIDPNSSLANTTEYIMVYNVIDIYGQHLSGAVSFTTVT